MLPGRGRLDRHRPACGAVSVSAPAWRSLLGALILLLLSGTVLSDGRQVVDGWDRQVSTPQPAQRVVALAPHLTEMLFALQAGERIVATVAYADYPDAAQQLPRVGDAFNLSLEALLGHRPDLVLAWSATMTPARLRRFADLGIPVFVSDPADLEAVLTEMQAIATLLDQPAEAILGPMWEVVHNHPPQTEQPHSVVPLIAAEPLMSVGQGHFLNDLLQRCGARNPFAEAVRRDAVVQLSRESLLLADLDLVVNLTRSELPERLRLPVGAQVVALDSDLLVRPGPRMVQGLRQLCEVIDAAAQRR